MEEVILEKKKRKKKCRKIPPKFHRWDQSFIIQCNNTTQGIVMVNIAC